MVFPKVPFKFYVTASPEVRAARRFAQLKKQGRSGITLKSVLKQHEGRDRQDSTRKIAPLKCPEDAVVVDTSSMGISQVVHFMRDHIKGQLTFPISRRPEGYLLRHLVNPSLWDGVSVGRAKCLSHIVVIGIMAALLSFKRLHAFVSSFSHFLQLILIHLEDSLLE